MSKTALGAALTAALQERRQQPEPQPELPPGLGPQPDIEHFRRPPKLDLTRPQYDPEGWREDVRHAVARMMRSKKPPPE